MMILSINATTARVSAPTQHWTLTVWLVVGLLANLILVGAMYLLPDLAAEVVLLSALGGVLPYAHDPEWVTEVSLWQQLFGTSGLLLLVVNPMVSLLPVDGEGQWFIVSFWSLLSLLGFGALSRGQQWATAIFYLSFLVTLVFTLAKFVIPNPVLFVAPLLLWYLTQTQSAGTIVAELWNNHGQWLLSGAGGGAIGGGVGGSLVALATNLIIQQLSGVAVLNISDSVLVGLQGGLIIGTVEGVATSLAVSREHLHLGQIAWISSVVGFIFGGVFWLIT